MPDTRTLSPEELRRILERLEEVMAEAEELRGRIAQQLSDERKQQVTPIRKPPRRR